MIGKYKVVTLCGSTRFKDAFAEVKQRLTLEGCFVLDPAVYELHGEKPKVDATTRKMLQNMYERAVDWSDALMVINVGGYVGDDTERILEYARKNGKHIDYLEER